MALACLTSMLLYHLSCYLHFKDNRPRNEHPPPFPFILRWLRVFLNYPPVREFEVSEASEVLEDFLGCPVIFGFLVLLKSIYHSLEIALPRGWVTCFLWEASSCLCCLLVLVPWKIWLVSSWESVGGVWGTSVWNCSFIFSPNPCPPLHRWPCAKTPLLCLTKGQPPDSRKWDREPGFNCS